MLITTAWRDLTNLAKKERDSLEKPEDNVVFIVSFGNWKIFIEEKDGFIEVHSCNANQGEMDVTHLYTRDDSLNFASNFSKFAELPEDECNYLKLYLSSFF